MNETLKQRIFNFIENYGTNPINTQYLANYFFSNDQTINKEMIEEYLTLNNYLKVSYDRMYKIEDLKRYCTINDISDSNKLKRCMFIDFGVPYITITDDELLNIIDKENIIIHEPDKKELYVAKENLESKIIVKDTKEKYIIKNREDIKEYGLDNTFISFDLLEEYCALFPNESYNEIKFLCHDLGIKLTSKDINFEVIKGNKLYEEMHYETNTEEELNSHFTFYHKSQNDVKIRRINEGLNIKKNSLMLHIRINEIIATFINLSYEGSSISYSTANKHFKHNHLNEFVKMGLLIKQRGNKKGYIITDECRVISEKINKKARISPNRDLFMDKLIMDKSNIDSLIDIIRDDLLIVLKKFDNFKFLINVIEEVNRCNSYNMINILDYCVLNGYKEEFLLTFIGGEGSTGKTSIRDGRDICLLNNKSYIEQCNCIICYSKHDINDDNKISKLLDIRNRVSELEYKKIENNLDNIKILKEDPLVLKFLVRFGVTFYNKKLLKDLKFIDSEIYKKSHGEYCPYKDEWRLRT